MDCDLDFPCDPTENDMTAVKSISRLDWEATIRDGIATWKTATEGAVTAMHAPGDCDTDNSGNIGFAVQIGNLVWIASDDYVRTFCLLRGLGACVLQHTSEGHEDQSGRMFMVIGKGSQIRSGGRHPTWILMEGKEWSE